MEVIFMFALTFSALRLTTVKSSLFDNVAFVGNPCPQIYIPHEKLYKHLFIIY